MHMKKETIRSFFRGGILAICLTTALLLAAPSTLAQSAGSTSPSGTGQEAICRGSRNWEASGIAIWNQFMDPRDFGEYWKDITVRYWNNICNYEDIYSLLKRIDKAREQLRKAFYNCTSTERIKTTYYRLESELYFIRNYVDYQKEQDNKGNTVTKYFIRQMDESWTDFTSSYLGKRSEKIALYNEFYTQYLNRLDTYNNCKDATIEDLIFKLQEDYMYLKDTVKAAGKSISQKADRLAGTASSLWDSVASGNYFKNMLQVNLNGMPCPVLAYVTEKDPEKKKELGTECAMGLEPIMISIMKNTPGLTFSKLQQTVAKIAQQSNELTDDTTTIARFKYMYFYSSDDMTKELIKRLDSLNNIISKQTPPYLNQTIQCVKSIKDAQCSNIQ